MEEKEYEYNNSKYGKAVTNIKAALFDILKFEKHKTKVLEKRISELETENEKNDIQVKLETQKEKLDKILGDVDSVIKDIEILDSLNIEISNIDINNLKNSIDAIDDLDVKEAFNKDMDDINKKKEDLSSKIEDKVNDIVLNSDLDKKKKEQLNEDISLISKAEDEPRLNIEMDDDASDDNFDDEEDISDLDNAIEAVDNQLSIAKKTDDEVKNLPAKEKTDEVLVFSRENKKIIKAILVKQNQLNNLKASKEKQKQIVNAIGLFDDYDYLNSTKNALEGSLNNAKKIDLDLDIDVNADKERQIEDLMVKANIYANEGEIDTAQAIYDKINLLNGKNEDTSEDHETNSEEHEKEKVKSN